MLLQRSVRSRSAIYLQNPPPRRYHYKPRAAGQIRPQRAAIGRIRQVRTLEYSVTEDGTIEYDDIIEYATKQAKFMATYIVDMDVQKRIF